MEIFLAMSPEAVEPEPSKMKWSFHCVNELAAYYISGFCSSSASSLISASVYQSALARPYNCMSEVKSDFFLWPCVFIFGIFLV